MKIENEVWAQKNMWGDSISLVIAISANGVKSVVKPPLEAIKISEYDLIEPTIQISTTAGQKLMDQLWDCGLRPSEGSGSAGAMAATQKHLDDMRRLVFKEKGPAR